MNKTSIEWTDYSCNAMKLQLPNGSLVNACAKISPGCASCYAEGIVRRYWKKSMGPFPGYTKAMLRLGKPHLVESELQAVLRLDARIAAGKAPADEVHQVLTKRPEMMSAYMTHDDGESVVSGRVRDMLYRWPRHNPDIRLSRPPDDLGMVWPLSNVWLGCSVEDQPRAHERIPHLLRTPAAVRFLSAEPLLGPIDFNDLSEAEWNYNALSGLRECPFGATVTREQGPRIDWTILGGESGPGARPCDFDWIRSIIQQCKAADVPAFCKQIGSNPVYGNMLQPPVEDPKGGNMEEWPSDLRVRQMPGMEVAAK